MIHVDLSNYPNRDPAFYLGIEEYYLKDSSDDILILWRPKPCAIIGRHQIPQNEVDTFYAEAHDICLCRRQSGGGAIYADQNNLMFTFIGRHQNKETLFINSLQHIINVFKKKGILIEFSGRNDLLYNGKKISGTAFYYHKNRALIHGTLMFDVDIKTMTNVLSPNPSKLIEKGIKSVKQRVINIKDFSNLNIDSFISELVITSGASTYLFTDDDLKNAIFYISRIRSDEWFKSKSLDCDLKTSHDLKSGKYEVQIKIISNRISKIVFHGDFFPLCSLTSLYNNLLGHEYNRTSIERAVEGFNASEFIKDLTNTELTNLILGEQ